MPGCARSALRLGAIALVGAILGGSAAVLPTVAADAVPSGHRVLHGRALDGFRVPTDVRLVRSWADPRTGLTYDRYQQHAVPLNVHVDGAQLTVVRRGQRVVLVAGRHYPGLRVSVRPGVAAPNAASRAAEHAAAMPGIRARGSSLQTRRSELRLNPETGRLFYLVESAAPGVRVFHEIDADTAEVIEAWDALHEADPGMGTGVKGDRKSLTGDTLSGSDPLTSKVGSAWSMRSPGASARYLTYNARNGWDYGAWTPLMNDTLRSGWLNDNDWSAAAQTAAVDAQYYAAYTDRYYQQRFGLDVVGECLPAGIKSVVHYDVDYANAFWDGEYLVYGDGDGWYGAMSGGQDVVTHELSHAVSDCRAELKYRTQSGALNESFSDVMAVTAEWTHEEPLSSGCDVAPGQDRCADWLIAEDTIVAGPDPAIRDMADPSRFYQPSHWADRVYLNSDYDNGGVHYNSGIANHAFYLLAHGGRNARCSGPTDPQADCDVVVPAIGIERAARIFFDAWGLLTYEATFCEARDDSVAAARMLADAAIDGFTDADVAAIDLAWRAVGVGYRPCATTGFAVIPSTRAVLVAPSGSATVKLELERTNRDTSPITVTVSDPAPASAAVAQPATLGSTGDSLLLTLDAGSAGTGVYPVLITASDGSATAPSFTSLALVVDGEPPRAQVQSLAIAAGAEVNDGALPFTVTWDSSDAHGGIAAGHLEQLTSEWSSVSAAAEGSLGVTLPEGSHQFRASATDAVGNSFTSAPFVAAVSSAQETAAVYGSGWSTSASAAQWGTPTRYAKAAGASARFSFTGTDIAWVGPRGPKRGKARVYIDGHLRATVDLRASTNQDRRVVFVASGLTPAQHTLRIVVLGTTNRPRVDIDGFIIAAPAP